MYENTLKKKLADGENVVGCIVGGPLPNLVEIAGIAGFDFIFIDAEHGPLSEVDCENLIRACEVVQTIPIVRVRELNAELILRYLDVGAMGIIVPGIRNKKEADAAVRAVKYYPRGERGLSATRSSEYGMGMPMKDYVKFANEQTMVLTIIENMDGVNNIEEILGTDGMDAAIIGASDLGHSLGHPGEGKHPELIAAFDKALQNGMKTGKPIGAVVRAGETSKYHFNRGCKIAITTAYGLLGDAAKNFVKSSREDK